MIPHEFKFGDKPWPDGEGTLQIYAPVDLAANPELARLVAKARTAMEGAPVAFVGDNELHITIDMLSGVHADQVSPGERRKIAETLQEALAGTPVYRGTAGSPLVYVTGPILDVSPAAALDAVQKTTRSVLFDLYGEAGCTFHQSKAHITIAYCHTPTDPTPWMRKVRKIDPAHAPLTIDSVELVDVRPDNTTKALPWSPVAPPIRFADA
ncbi:hypothetical protein [Amycolatopsis sp. NPDC004079]|uniref:hypothetical protein n=1 Tax=Amycolatopsis sp. NPDC004079 TaxID=3154549 RepID=UPI0033A5C9AB